MNSKKFFLMAIGAAFLFACMLQARESLIVETNTAPEFDTLLKSNSQVIVQFYNPTCPVCNAFKKKGIYAQTAQALPHISFAMVSSAQGAGLHKEFKITVYPTFIFFKDGREIDRSKGYVENPMFTRKVNNTFSDQALEVDPNTGK